MVKWCDLKMVVWWRWVGDRCTCSWLKHIIVYLMSKGIHLTRGAALQNILVLQSIIMYEHLDWYNIVLEDSFVEGCLIMLEEWGEDLRNRGSATSEVQKTSV